MRILILKSSQLCLWRNACMGNIMQLSILCYTSSFVSSSKTIKNIQIKSRRNEKRHSKPLPNLPPRVPGNKQLFATGFEITIGWIIKGATQNFVPYVPSNASLSSFSFLPHSLDCTDSWGYTNKQWKENFSSSLAEISSKKKGNRKKHWFFIYHHRWKQRSTNNNTTQRPNRGGSPLDSVVENFE